MRLPFKNHTVFAGFVNNEPELRTLPGTGDATVSLRLVSRYSYKDNAGEWQSSDEWATAVLYRKLAEDFAASGLGKGAFIHIEGRRHTRKWTDGGGHNKTAHEIIVTDWHPVLLPKQEAAQPSTPEKQPRRAGRPASAKPPKEPSRTAHLA